jgi:hypothetical protein
MTKRKPRRPPVFKHIYDTESPMVVTWVSPRDPSRKGPGHPIDPRSAERAEAAADMVLRLKAKEPRSAWGDLVIDAAAKHHVGKEKIWEALRKRPEYKQKSYLPIHR